MTEQEIAHHALILAKRQRNNPTDNEIARAIRNIREMLEEGMSYTDDKGWH